MKFPTLGLLGLASVLASPALAQSPAPFPDVNAPHYAFDAVSALAARGVLKGYPDGSYQGRRALTRYEFAEGFSRFSGLVPEAIEEWRRTHLPREPPKGPAGSRGQQGPSGSRGAIGPDGPRGLVPAEWETLVREHQRQREDVSAILTHFARLREELPRLEIEEVWGPLERLDHRLRRAAKPIPGILRGRRR